MNAPQSNYELQVDIGKKLFLEYDQEAIIQKYQLEAETGLYYLQSRYYNPTWGRFINADALVSTGQGILGNNMFAYCLNNPVNYVDKSGKSTAALQWWTAGMSWLPFADTVLPIGDIIYAGGILLLGIAVLASDQDNLPTITYAPADGAYGPPSPNDDDDDDDYYDNDSNFGGREKIGKNKGNAPRSNKAQNAQFDYAAKKTGIKPNKVRAFHDYMSGQGEDVKELLEMAETFLSFLLGYFCFAKE